MCTVLRGGGDRGGCNNILYVGFNVITTTILFRFSDIMDLFDNILQRDCGLEIVCAYSLPLKGIGCCCTLT